MNPKIPFNKPALVGLEQQYISEAIASGQVSGDGSFSKRCHKLLEETLGISKALVTTSCTHALEMSALLLNIKPGDEVIVPSFTFVSTVNAFVLRGATPIFADICPDTLNIDEKSIEKLISKKTKAIVPVHYAGVACEMDAILSLAAAHGIAVVEDNAHGLFGKYKNRFLGSFGALATQSFHETKNFQCGEGGALLINDSSLSERAEIIREKGTNRSRFFRGQVDKYTWVDLGSSYLLSDILAAVLYGQLEQRQAVQQRREMIWRRYEKELSQWAQENGVKLPFVPEHCEQPYHMFYMIMPELDERQRFIQHLRDNEILAVYHYLPLHISTMGATFGGRAGDCPITEFVSDRLVRLPLFFGLTEQEQDSVIRCIQNFSVRIPSRSAIGARTN